jgi:glutathione S-transferase
MATDEPLVLHVDAGFLSPYAMSAFVALLEKGIAFRVETVDLQAGAQHGPAYAAISTTRRVPTLVHGAFHLSESSAISEYLDDAFPGARLYPDDVRERAVARQVQAWLRSDLLPLRAERPTEVVFLGERRPPLSDAARAAADKLLAAAGDLLSHGGPTLFGRWCIADVDLAVMLNRLVLGGDPVPQRLADHARAQWARPSVRRWLAASPRNR